MPRRDRTFSHFDVIRIACRNLSEIEKSTFKAQLRGVLGESQVGMDSLLSLVCTLNKSEANSFLEKMLANPCGLNLQLSIEAGLAAYGNIDRSSWSAMRRAFLMEIFLNRKQYWRDVFSDSEMKVIFEEIFLNQKSKDYIGDYDICEYFVTINDFTAQGTNIITAFQILPVPLFAAVVLFPAAAPYLLAVISFILAYEPFLTALNLAFVALNQLFIQVLMPIWGCSEVGTGIPKYYLPEVPEKNDFPDPRYPGGLQ